MFQQPSVVEQIKFSANNKHLIGKSLSAFVTLASSVGAMAEHGKQHHIKEEVADRLIASIQVGEYIQTGEIPSSELVRSVLVIQ